MFLSDKKIDSVICIGPAYPLRGGISNFNVALSQSFIKNGINCSICSFSLQYPKILFPGKTQFEEAGKAPENIKIYSTINSVNPFSWFKTAKKIRKNSPDLVIIHYWMPFMAPSLGTIARKIKKNKKTKIIAITHNVIPHEKRTGDKTLTRFFLKSCDGFVALAESVKNDINRFVFSPKAIFNPHPIYDIFGDIIEKKQARKYLNLNPEDKIILFFGLIRDYKGLDILLEAMSDERIKNANIKLVVAGEFYEDKSKYEKIINSKKIKDKVIITGTYIAQDEVKYYFSAADIIVQPYKTATQSGVTQIGYHFNKAMLVTNVGGLAEIIPHNKVGYVVEPEAGKIADALFDFYDKNKEKEFSENAATEKEKYSWKNMINSIIKLYVEIKQQ